MRQTGEGTATLSLSNLNQTYDGSPKPATVTTSPAGLSGVSVTYDGSSTAPTNAGSYAVVASLNNPDYQATNAPGTLVIGKLTVTVTPTAGQNKTYGATDPTLTYGVTPALVGSDTFTGALSRASGAGPFRSANSICAS